MVSQFCPANIEPIRGLNHYTVVVVLIDSYLQDMTSGFVRMYFGTKIVIKRGVLDYTWLSAVAEMGGYAGLLLGVAVVDVAFAADGFWLKISKFFNSNKIV